MSRCKYGADISFVIKNYSFCLRKNPIFFAIDWLDFTDLEKADQLPAKQIEFQYAPQPTALETLGQATVSIIFKYFSIVDLLMNFFNAINVDVGSELSAKVEFLENAKFPKIGFLEKLSFTSEGGQEQVDNYLERLEIIQTLLDYEDRRVLSGMANPNRSRRAKRRLSELEKGFSMAYFTDDKPEEFPPDEFYHFLRVSRNTREKIISTNKDIFLIFGQNGIICSIFILAYFAVWLTRVGESKKKVLRILVFLQRQFFVLFMVNLEYVALTELALHNIATEPLPKYRFSYFLSWAVVSIIMIEYLRAWEVVRKKGLTTEQLSEQNYELGMIKKNWVGDLDESQQSEGNVFMIVDKLRWTVF